MTSHPCPRCSEPAAYSKKRGQYVCLECDVAFGSVAKASSVPPTLATKTLKVFLSYGRDDHVAEVKALRDALRARGHEVWFDEEQLGTGLDWEQRIEAGLAWCDRVVLTMTPHSVRRPDGYCLNEIAKALELRKLIIPVLLVEVPQGAPTSICRIQYLDWRDAVPAAEKAERFTQRLTRLCEAIEEDKLDFEGGQQRLIRHLQPLNFDGDLQRHVASFKGRVRLEARLRQWLADPQGSQVLWLTAAPGLGKSAVAATLSHRWAEVAAVHFCVAGQQDKANPARAVLSIAYQLSQRQHMNLYASKLSNLELEREAHKDARTLFDTLLVGPLAKNFPAPPEPLLVILDGLDEATQPGGENPLAEIIAADWGRLPPWLRLMVSSRPEAELVTWLAGTQRIEIRGDDGEQQADLSAFLRERLAAIGRPPGDETLQRILSRSEGAFHYAVLLLEEVRQGRCDPDNPVDLPAGLNPFYAQTFKRRFPDITAYRGQTRPLLELILAAPEPVPLVVLAGATQRAAQDIRLNLSALGSMLAIEPGQGETDVDWDTVRLSHASLRSWLTGLDATRQPLAGAYAAKVDTKGLAAEVLRLWEAGNEPGNAVCDAASEPKRFVPRTLWRLLKAAGDRAAKERVALALSLYWKNRQLKLAIEPGAFAAERALMACEERTANEVLLEQAGKSFIHLGELQRALGQSVEPINSFQRALAAYEQLTARHPDQARWKSLLGESHHHLALALEVRGHLAEALEEHRKSLCICEGLTAQDPGNADWQRDLGVSYNRLSDVLRQQGDLAGALEGYRQALTITERLVVHDPENAVWQGDLAYSNYRVGNVLGDQGDSAGALEAFRKCLIIAERLVAKDPDTAEWHYSLHIAHSSIGELLQVQGNLVGALENFEEALAISERLTAQDPENTKWQSKLAASYARIGDVLQAQGNLTGALGQFRKNLTITERLAEKNPDNAGWQSGLAVSYNRIGGVLKSQGNLAGALEQFRKNLTINERLAKQDPENAKWQSKLAASYARIGDVLQAQGNLTGALGQFRENLTITERLAEQDPDNAGWQGDLAVSYNRIGVVLQAQGNLAGALEQFRKDLVIRERLAEQDQDDARWQRDLSFSYTRIGDALQAQGNLAGALEQYRKALTITERLAEQDPDHADGSGNLATATDG